MDKRYIVRTKDINDDITLLLLEFGTINYVSKHINVCEITMDSSNLDKLKECDCVISAKESKAGSYY